MGAETVGPDGEALVYLNPQTGTYHRRATCYGRVDNKEPVQAGEVMFDADCEPCRSCWSDDPFGGTEEGDG